MVPGMLRTSSKMLVVFAAVTGCICLLFVIYNPVVTDRIRTTDDDFADAGVYRDKVVMNKLEPIKLSTKLRDSLQLDQAFPVRTTVSGQNRLMFYNKVAKCASRTMVDAITRLGARNKFVTRRSFTTDGSWLHTDYSQHEWNELAKEISNLPSNTVAITQTAFLDFDRIGAEFPIYINLVRHPVDRFVSSYYFRRNGAVLSNSSKRRQNRLNSTTQQSVNECVLENVTTCVQNNYHSIVHFFCGDHVHCRSLNDRSLQKAKENLVKHYAAVGIFEDFNTTIYIFEHLLPRYFTGLRETMTDDTSSAVAQRTRTIGRVELNAGARSLLSVALLLDIEFYDFIRMRFYKQLAILRTFDRDPVGP